MAWCCLPTGFVLHRTKRRSAALTKYKSTPAPQRKSRKLARFRYDSKSRDHRRNDDEHTDRDDCPPLDGPRCTRAGDALRTRHPSWRRQPRPGGLREQLRPSRWRSRLSFLPGLFGHSCERSRSNNYSPRRSSLRVHIPSRAGGAAPRASTSQAHLTPRTSRNAASACRSLPPFHPAGSINELLARFVRAGVSR